jgi:citrate synthase
LARRRLWSILTELINVGIAAMAESWLSASIALDRLKVRPQTLYAYVSRGLVEARPDPDDPRRSLYRAADIETLSRRKARGRRAAAIATEAIAWGEPVLPSALSTVSKGRLFYRGRDAAALAETATLEEVAALLWDASAPPTRFSASAIGASTKARLFAGLAARAAQDPPMAGRAQPLLQRDGAQVLAEMAASVSGREGDEPAHLRIARAWRTDADLVRRALVLLADHELNASAFAARVAASTGASLSACVLAGLATLSGPRHGAHYLRVQAFLGEVETLGAEGAVRARLDQGVGMPGFGHPLYPDGDVRAEALLGQLRLSALEDGAVAAVQAATGLAPNIDFALCVLTRAASLPPEAPFGLFAAGRCAGWIGHALEQDGVGDLIRPRARYVGPEPVFS